MELWRGDADPIRTMGLAGTHEYCSELALRSPSGLVLLYCFVAAWAAAANGRIWEMSALKDYERYAVRCLQEARVTTDSGHKAFLVEMAQVWRKLADQARTFEGVKELSDSEPDRGD